MDQLTISTTSGATVVLYREDATARILLNLLERYSAATRARVLVWLARSGWDIGNSPPVLLPIWTTELEDPENTASLVLSGTEYAMRGSGLRHELLVENIHADPASFAATFAASCTFNFAAAQLVSGEHIFIPNIMHVPTSRVLADATGQMSICLPDFVGHRDLSRTDRGGNPPARSGARDDIEPGEESP